MLRVGVFRPEDLAAGARRFIIAWSPRTETGLPGVCVAPHATLPVQFPYDCDTKDFPGQPDVRLLFELAADLVMNGAPFALLDAAFLVFADWRALTLGGVVAHTENGAWNPHNPDYPDDVLESHRQDTSMLWKRIEHDKAAGFPNVEVVSRVGP